MSIFYHERLKIPKNAVFDAEFFQPHCTVTTPDGGVEKWCTNKRYVHAVNALGL